jgi:hypothetical protein
MGNVVGTISYDPVEHHRFHELIHGIRQKHRLSKSGQQMGRPGQDYIDVEIGGLNLAFYGEKNTRRDIGAFLWECEKELKKAGATNVKSQIEFLPM